LIRNTNDLLLCTARADGGALCTAAPVIVTGLLPEKQNPGSDLTGFCSSAGQTGV